MSFSVAFYAGTPSIVDTQPDIDNEFDILVQEICEAIEEWDGADFTLSGFGRERWPVDIGYDLSVFVEQLPDLLRFVSAGSEFRLDMYSQGIESMFTFSVYDDRVAVTCSSRTGWVPNPRTEEIDRGSLLNMLWSLASNFAVAAASASPNLAKVDPLNKWLARMQDDL